MPIKIGPIDIDQAQEDKLIKSLGVDKLAIPEKEMNKWVEVAESLLDSSRSFVALTTLNASLEPCTFLHGHSVSLADLAVFGSAHGPLSALSDTKRLSVVNVCRWFDHIQFLPGVASLGMSTVAFDRNAPLQKSASGPVSGAGGGDDKRKAKREAKRKEKEEAKKANKGKGKGKGKGSPADDQPQASCLDIRVGHIKKAWKHPEADSLYIEEIDVGEAEVRTVVSGLVKFIPEADMQDKMVTVLCNLKPSSMRGVKSYAMVLCATSPDGSTVEFVTPPEGAKPGDRVYFPGMEKYEPLPQLPPKKKIFEAVAPELKTSDEKVAMYKDLPFTTEKGVCKVATVVGGGIK